MYLGYFHFVTRRSSENTTAHVSNDKQLCGKSLRSIRPCPEWGVWLRGIVGACLGCVWGAVSCNPPGHCYGLGRKHTGPIQPVAGGAVGPFWVSPRKRLGG